MSDNKAVQRPPGHNPHADPRQTGDALMRRRRWAEAAAAFEPVAGADPATEMKRRLSANLASLQSHRPDVYQTLIALPSQQQYSVAATTSGKPTLLCRRPDGTCVSLSASQDPLASAAAARAQIHAATKSGEAVGLCGMGDGYLVQVLAHNPPSLFMDKQQPVFLIEPEPQIVLQCLMIHDYAGARGPIEQPRFHWFVGGGWERRLDAALSDDLFLASPSLMVGQGFDAQQIQAQLRTVVQKLADLDAALARTISQRYAGVDAAGHAGVFAGRAGRRPRVLLLTTRFSTVLQYSTRDTAAAFERLGWEARVLMEPSPHHRVLRTAIRAALVDFAPDLVFQIDHLRHEHNGLFPEGLPFACWIQDHLPHLATREAGGQVGPLDFVLTDATATYVDKFGYPARQCVALPKLTAEGNAEQETAARGPASAQPVPDVVFVSNASATPAAMTAEAVMTYGQSPESRELVTRCCERMVEAYASGHSLPTYDDVCAVLTATLADLHLNLPTADFDRLARWLTHPFNDALYRQQALRWAAGAASELGLSLGLYGRGWESHPEFAPYARGPVAYGEALARLTRGSRVNLQIVPYLCLHQRLLDGLMAGGFFLVRTHPADLAPAELLNFLDAHVNACCRTTPAAAASLPLSLHPTFNGLLSACRPCLSTTGREDLVTMVRDWQDAGQLVAGEGPLPRLAETGFHDASTLRERLRRFAQSPSLREEISAAQRGSVSRRLTYDAGIARVVARVCDLLHSEATTQESLPRALAA